MSGALWAIKTGASHPGTFTCTPVSGSVLAAGTQTLSVSFVPTDTTDYTTPAAPTTVQLQVNKAALAVSLTSSVNPVFVQNLITFAAAAGFGFGSGLDGPTGTVTFQDGAVAPASCP